MADDVPEGARALPMDVEQQRAAAKAPRANRVQRAARVDAIIAFTLAEKRVDKAIAYNVLSHRIRARFACSVSTAERAIAAANEELRKEFERFCATAPQVIFDSYMELHHEHMLRSASSSRERDRVMHLANARRNLDAVRDMFGMRAAIDININLGNVVSADAYGALTDAQIDALATIDAYEAPRVLDVPSIEQSLELAGVAIDAIEAQEADVDDDET